MARVLPPGLSEQDFDAAIARFREVVGDKYVTTDDGALARYRDPYPVGSEVRPARLPRFPGKH